MRQRAQPCRPSRHAHHLSDAADGVARVWRLDAVSAAQSGLYVIVNVCFWHIAAFAATQHFVAYWSNNGQRSGLALNGSAANDPKRTFASAGRPIRTRRAV